MTSFSLLNLCSVTGWGNCVQISYIILIYLVTILIIISTENINDISASSSHVRIVSARDATLPKAELCRSLIAILGLPKFMSEP